ncbi:DUF616 domain-containing protein, partial [archaeon]
MISTILCLFCFALSIAVGTCLNKAINFSNATFPCEAGCISNQPCFKTAWGPTLNFTRAITAPCDYVLYSISLGPRDASSLHPVQDYWGGKPCSIYMLGNHSKFVQTHKLQTGSIFRNWLIVLVNDLLLEQQYGSYRRAVKLVKMSTHMVLHPNVKYAIFIDAKLVSIHHPKTIVENYAERYGDVILAAVHHPNRNTIEQEFQAISSYENNGSFTSITDNITKIADQVQFYEKNGLKKLPFQQVLIDSAYEVIRVHDKVSIQLRCAWLNQIQTFGDRDQISLPYVLVWMTYNNTTQNATQPNLF